MYTGKMIQFTHRVMEVRTTGTATHVPQWSPDPLCLLEVQLFSTDLSADSLESLSRYSANISDSIAGDIAEQTRALLRICALQMTFSIRLYRLFSMLSIAMLWTFCGLVRSFRKNVRTLPLTVVIRRKVCSYATRHFARPRVQTARWNRARTFVVSFMNPTINAKVEKAALWWVRTTTQTNSQAFTKLLSTFDAFIPSSLLCFRRFSFTLFIDFCMIYSYHLSAPSSILSSYIKSTVSCDTVLESLTKTVRASPADSSTWHVLSSSCFLSTFHRHT